VPPRARGTAPFSGRSRPAAWAAAYPAADWAQIAQRAFLASRVLDAYTGGEFDVVTLIYSSFKSVVTQTPTVLQLIPAQVQASSGPAPFYDYEPDEDTILEALLPQNISVQILTAMLENQAGFFAAQMTAMDNATRNAGDMIKALTIQMNRTRQAQITKELIEIISGASAV
jgi:F-type H+-transporting ATPase subunit gamma